jgi:hypothetical protein
LSTLHYTPFILYHKYTLTVPAAYSFLKIK